MRLREPFQGYKLSSGHLMFHIAYLIGSYISTEMVLSEKTVERDHQATNILRRLNLAHILVPVFNLLSVVCEHNQAFAI